ncbi:MAG TPA: NUDIX domain-containing protein [Acetobacteraceae bacterium]
MPDDTALAMQAKARTVRARHAASLVVLRVGRCGPEMLMGMRGARHRFMPNRLVFPGGAVDRPDLRAASASPLSAHTQARLEKAANPLLAHGLGVAAARELEEETGLTLGGPPALDGLEYLCRLITPPGGPIRFNARFLLVEAGRVSGSIAGSGELEELRFYTLGEALALDLALPTRKVIERVQVWLAMTPAERTQEQRMPVLRRREWRYE